MNPPDSPSSSSSSSSSKMECTISSLMFKGSIAEAILEAKRQRKLFVVYISGEDDQSIRLENSTLMDRNVAESLSKYCIVLQFSDGSTDAAHFSAIYPQKSIPCITAVGYNGVQLWQNEGFVSAEILASSLEKAWLGLHMQETTATVLSAALASKTETSPSGTSDMASIDKGSSSMDIVPPSTDRVVQSSETRQFATSEIIEENKGSERPVEKLKTKVDSEAHSNSSYDDELEISKDEEAASTKIQRELLSPEKFDLDDSGVCRNSINIEVGCAPEKINNAIDHYSRISEVALPMVNSDSDKVVPDDKTEPAEIKKADIKPSDIHLNIRLPDGATLQEKFSVASALRMVKDSVDKSELSNVGSYDLAIPYPRQVFNDQDLSKSLSELGLLNRQALIVVPRQRASAIHKGGSPSRAQRNSTRVVDSSSENSGGYFAYVRSVLSYLNPFSYFGGSTSSSSSEQESRNVSQYGPNPALQNGLRGAERPYTRYTPNQTTSDASRNDRNSSRPTTSRIGSNIHTLKRDEDDGRFGDRNSFWNGNSTEYGGDNDGK